MPARLGGAPKATVETTAYEPHERIEGATTGARKLNVVCELEPVEKPGATRLRQTSHMQTQGCLRVPGWQGYIKYEKGDEQAVSRPKVFVGARSRITAVPGDAPLRGLQMIDRSLTGVCLIRFCGCIQN